MTFRAALRRALCWSILSLSLGGCASLPFFGDKTKEAPASAETEPAVAQYELEVEAPGPLRTLLLEYLDISRFQNAPRSEAVTPTELVRLAAAAPAQAKSLLETEGYFNAEVTIVRSEGASGMPRLTLTVVPGPRVVV
jgi:translocation and assembly module TamA